MIECSKTNYSIRKSNIELFRIISMLVIVAHHYVVNSGLFEAIKAKPISANSLFLLCFGGGGKLGINCFMLITGYYMCKSNITIKKFCYYIFKFEFYKLIIFIIFLLLGYETLSISTIISFLPVSGVNRDFYGCFICFYLCIPFLNKLINCMNEKEHCRLIILSVFIYTVLPTIPKIFVTINYVSWFIVLYFISSYIRIYQKKIYSNNKIWGMISLLSVFACIVSIIVMTNLFSFEKTYYFVSDSNAILALITAVSLFMFFNNLSIKGNRFINTVSGSTFGVLLIHANSTAMRTWLWKDTLKNVEMLGSKYMLIHAIGSVLIVYIVCTIIDFFVKNTIEKYYYIWFDRISERVSMGRR